MEDHRIQIHCTTENIDSRVIVGRLLAFLPSLGIAVFSGDCRLRPEDVGCYCRIWRKQRGLPGHVRYDAVYTNSIMKDIEYPYGPWKKKGEDLPAYRTGMVLFQFEVQEIHNDYPLLHWKYSRDGRFGTDDELVQHYLAYQGRDFDRAFYKGYCDALRSGTDRYAYQYQVLTEREKRAAERNERRRQQQMRDSIHQLLDRTHSWREEGEEEEEEEDAMDITDG